MAGGRLTRIRLGSVVAIALGASGLLFATSTVAGADGSTTPPASSVPTSCSTSSTVTVGSAPQSVSLGETCAFAPNSAVTVSFNGATVASPTSDSNGLITLSVTATDPTLAFNGGTAQPAVYGINTVTATGTNASGATNTASFLIDLVSSAPATAASTTSSSSSSGGLAFTGADLAALAAAALALILLGAGVVSYTRRRAEDAA
jgi:hypothetical protein